MHVLLIERQSRNTVKWPYQAICDKETCLISGILQGARRAQSYKFSSMCAQLLLCLIETKKIIGVTLYNKVPLGDLEWYIYVWNYYNKICWSLDPKEFRYFTVILRCTFLIAWLFCELQRFLNLNMFASVTSSNSIIKQKIENTFALTSYHCPSLCFAYNIT